jgi:hypothetical protein
LISATAIPLYYGDLAVRLPEDWVCFTSSFAGVEVVAGRTSRLELLLDQHEHGAGHLAHNEPSALAPAGHCGMSEAVQADVPAAVAGLGTPRALKFEI